MLIHNPIIPGFHPDPSAICVGEDYYIATSSFSFFPGIPIYHSRDLVHWEQISHAFSVPEWLPVNPSRISKGMYAPTLRYHNGTFYVIVFNAFTRKTYVTTSPDPKGPWSMPHILPETFDPDIFFDDDGTCYVASCIPDSSETSYENYKIGIYVLDTEKWELGEPRGVWSGALIDACSPEAPHLYKIDGYYYLMIAEGGTEYYHAVTIARSENIYGPYEGYDGNPIFTMRHLRHNYPIAAAGHADLFRTSAGEWYMVFLGSRLYGGYHKNMGRETFIAPVIWENGWPVVSPDTGKCEFTYPAPKGLKPCPFIPPLKRDDFDDDHLALCWNILGTPVNQVCRLADSRLYLRAASTPIRPADNAKNTICSSGTVLNPADFKPYAMAFVGRRQEHISFSAATRMTFDPGAGETAGLVYLQNNFAALRIELAAEGGKKVLRVMKFLVDQHDEIFKNRKKLPLDFGEVCLREIDWNEKTVFLRICTDGQSAFVIAGKSETDCEVLLENVDVSYVSSETCSGYVGAYLGMFCSGNGVESENEAAFDWFEYSGEDTYSQENEQ